MVCPEGSEGVIYALMTTITNLGSTVSYDFATIFTYIWDVSNDTLLSGDYTGVMNLTILAL